MTRALIETERNQYQIRETASEQPVVFDVKATGGGDHTTDNLSLDEARRIRDALAAVIAKVDPVTYTETVELESVLSGGAVAELASAAREHGLMVNVTFSPYED